MSNKTNPVKRIGLMGPFGLGNLGDAAIQQTMLEHLRQFYPTAEIFGFSLSAEDTEKRHGLPSFPIGRMADSGWFKPGEMPSYLARIIALKDRLRANPNQIISLIARLLLSFPIELLSIFEASKKLRGFDYFIMSGGGQLDDYWGGPTYHPYTLLVWSLIAKLRGAKLFFVSVGAGPLDARLSRWLVKGALALADYRSYRDGESKQFMARLGFKRPDPVYPDLAHSLPVTAYVEASQTRTERLVVGVGPLPYFDPRNWPENDAQVYRCYLTKLADFVTWLLRQDYEVLLFPGEAINDRHVIEDLRERLVEYGISQTDSRIYNPPIETVDELMLNLANTDLVITSRFHGVLLSQLLNKPVLALSYHQKIDSLMANMGQTEYCLSIDRFDLTTLQERFNAMRSNCAQIKATLARNSEQFQQALDEQYRFLFANS